MWQRREETILARDWSVCTLPFPLPSQTIPKSKDNDFGKKDQTQIMTELEMCLHYKVGYSR